MTEKLLGEKDINHCVKAEKALYQKDSDGISETQYEMLTFK